MLRFSLWLYGPLLPILSLNQNSSWYLLWNQYMLEICTMCFPGCSSVTPKSVPHKTALSLSLFWANLSPHSSATLHPATKVQTQSATFGTPLSPLESTWNKFSCFIHSEISYWDFKMATQQAEAVHLRFSTSKKIKKQQKIYFLHWQKKKKKRLELNTLRFGSVRDPVPRAVCLKMGTRVVWPLSQDAKMLRAL